MSIWDNVKKFAQPYNDDEYDEYDDEEEYMDDYEEEEEKPRRSRASRSSRRSAPVREREREPEQEPERECAPVQEFDDDYEDAFNAIPKSSPAASAASSASGSFSGRVVNMNKKDIKDDIVLFRPTNYDDAFDAGNDLKQNHPIILNLEGVDGKVARRVVDFLSGCVFATNGSVKKVAKSVYLFCPSSMQVSDKLGDLGAEVEQLV